MSISALRSQAAPDRDQGGPATAPFPGARALIHADGRVVWSNPACDVLLRGAAVTIVGEPLQRFAVEPDLAARLAAAAGDGSELRFTSRRDDGQEASIVIEAARGHGDVLACSLRKLDHQPELDAVRHREARLAELAVHDELTGVGNHRGLIAELERRLAHGNRHDEQGSVLVLDLDGFSRFADHERDARLVAVAGALRARLRATDFIARSGGDEFAIVLPHTPPWTARLVAEQLLGAIRALGEGDLTAGCAVAGYSGRTPSVARLLTEAERALDAAKLQGADRVSVAGDPGAAGDAYAA